MGFKFNHRKMRSESNYNTTLPSYRDQDRNYSSSASTSCLINCPLNCKCQDDYDFPPPLSLPPPAGGDESRAKQLVTMGMIVMSCIIVGTLLFGICCAAIRVYYLRRNNSRRANPPITFAVQEDFFDEDHGPVLDHHIWYINTIGLPQSFIDSISVFKYKKDVGFIEGTDCSVCLSEFQEDESLRLLPKCSHAFHISCIDTWLRSHTNCPLCRAPIISPAFVAQASDREPNQNALNSRNEIMVVNSENASGEGSDNLGSGTSEVRIGDDNNNNGSPRVEDELSADDSIKISPHLKIRNLESGCRVLSDLAENRRVVEEDTQTLRRSVSLDSSAACMIYNAVAEGAIHDKRHDIINVHLEDSKNSTKSVAKRGRGSSSSSICRLMKSSSIGSSLQRGPLLMKRSFSSIGKFSSSRHSRRYSVLPL